MLVKSGRFFAQSPEKAAEIGVEFLNFEKVPDLKAPVLEKGLKEPQGTKKRRKPGQFFLV